MCGLPPQINNRCCGPPLGWATQLCFSWPLRFSCMCSCIRHWASRINGLPVHTHTRPEVSGIGRSPRPSWSLLWASRFNGPPGCISSGLRRGPASRYVVVASTWGLPRGRASPASHRGLRRGPASWSLLNFVVGLPIRRASHTLCIGPPAWTGFQVCHCIIDAGPPAWTGFPFTSIGAFGVHRPPRLG